MAYRGHATAFLENESYFNIFYYLFFFLYSGSLRRSVLTAVNMHEEIKVNFFKAPRFGRQLLRSVLSKVDLVG